MTASWSDPAPRPSSPKPMPPIGQRMNVLPEPHEGSMAEAMLWAVLIGLAIAMLGTLAFLAVDFLARELIRWA